MAKNNLLLGNGQSLVGPTDWPNPPNRKGDVYSLQQARDHLHPQLELFARSAARIAPEAAPRGQVVGKVLVHPEYLAKSFFPAGVLRAAGLAHIGTRSNSISPRHRLRKRDRDKPMFTAELLVAGTPGEFKALDQLLMSSTVKTVQRDLMRIEDIGLMDAGDRIRALRPLSDGTLLLEAVLHADENDDDILSDFAQWARFCDGRADLERTISIDGLSFMPVHIPATAVEQLAIFTHLRVLRSVQTLREEQIQLRAAAGAATLRVPVGGPVTDAFRVAVFDAGLDTVRVGAWATENTWPETVRTDPAYVGHGSAVTSAVLFGPVDATTTELPRPFAPVDHFRIATPRDEKVPEMFDAVSRICEVLDRRQHSFVNISVAPCETVQDDDVHLWTSVLERRLASGEVLAAVAVGNHGEHPKPDNRIQVPADLVNALAVGAATAPTGPVARASKSCVGPGRSPGLVKPDGLAWGESLPLFDPVSGAVALYDGTSFASPVALRAGVGAAALAGDVSPMAARALLVHTAERPKKGSLAEIGHGRFALDPFDLITCGDREAMVIYQGQLEPGKPIGARLPWPDGLVRGKAKIRATLLFTTSVDLAHPINYTRAGIEARLRRSPGGATVPFFSKSRLFGQTEQEMRADAHKWETMVSKEIGADADTLNDPVLELIYRARDEGRPIASSKVEPLPYVLVITVAAKQEADYYNRVRQRYPVLAPIRLRAGISLPAQT